MPYSTYLNGKLNQSIFGKTAYTAPTTVYVGLSTSGPDQSGLGVAEPVGNGYARVAVTNNTTNWKASTTQPTDGGQQQENGNDVTFAAATGAGWGTITNFVIYDASSSGNLLAYGALASSTTINAGDQPVFPAGTLTIKLD